MIKTVFTGLRTASRALRHVGALTALTVALGWERRMPATSPSCISTIIIRI